MPKRTFKETITSNKENENPNTVGGLHLLAEAAEKKSNQREQTVRLPSFSTFTMPVSQFTSFSPQSTSMFPQNPTPMETDSSNRTISKKPKTPRVQVSDQQKYKILKDYILSQESYEEVSRKHPDISSFPVHSRLKTWKRNFVVLLCNTCLKDPHNTDHILHKLTEFLFKNSYQDEQTRNIAMKWTEELIRIHLDFFCFDNPNTQQQYGPIYSRVKGKSQQESFRAPKSATIFPGTHTRSPEWKPAIICQQSRGIQKKSKPLPISGSGRQYPHCKPAIIPNSSQRPRQSIHYVLTKQGIWVQIVGNPVKTDLRHFNPTLTIR